jgi:DNA-binding transcriptional MerR regulator
VDTSQTLYGAGVVADRLGISQAMLRRYARTLEALTGEQVYLHARDGRQYTQAQLDTLLGAKRLVDSNTGLKVEDAIRLALGDTELGLQVSAPSLQGMTRDDISSLLRVAITEPLQAVLQAQQQHHEDELRAVQDTAERNSQAVLEELRRVRAELEKLNKEPTPLEALPPAEQTQPVTERAADQEARHGPLVRLALWLESRFRG